MRVLVAIALLFGLLVTSAPAPAAPPSASTARSEAKKLAAKGYDLFDAGHYAESIEPFQQAEALFHAPTLVLALAEAYAKMGKLLEARALFQQVIDEKLAPNASPEFREAQKVAKVDLAALAKQIPTLLVTLTGAKGRIVSLTIDGAVLPQGDLTQPLERNPGSHKIVVVLPGGTDLSRSVDLKEGAHEQVTIDVPAPVEVKPPVVKATPTPLPKVDQKTPLKAEPKVPIGEAAAPRKGSLAPALVSFGVGAAGLGVGIWAGATTLSNAGAIKPSCNGNVCDPVVADTLRQTKTLSMVSNVAFAVAGVGAATGATFLVLRSKSKAPARVEVRAGASMVELSGVF